MNTARHEFVLSGLSKINWFPTSRDSDWGAVNTNTLSHFSVQAIGAIMLAVVHLGAVLRQELEQTQASIKGKTRGFGGSSESLNC